MSGSPQQPRIARLVLAFLAAWLVGVVSELMHAWPHGARGAVIGLVVLHAVALTAIWAGVVAFAVVAASGGVRRVWPGDAAGADLTWLPLLGPAAWLLLTLGERVQSTAARMFVRQDLAAAVVPVAMVLVTALLLLAMALVHRALAPRLRQLSRVALAGIGAALGVLAVAAHVARFSTLFDDALVPTALQLMIGTIAAVAIVHLPTRWRRVQPGGRTALVLGLLVAGTIGVMLGAERLAPRAYPSAMAAIQQRGLASARVATLVQRLLGVGDDDRDGYTLRAGGDCDDRNAAIHPYALDVIDDGIDQDCADGDLTSAMRAADQAPRIAARARPPHARAHNLMLVTVDALRADAPGFAGGAGLDGPGTPTMDALAARGTVFTRAYAQAPMTRRSFPTLLASRYPSNVRWMDLQTKYPYTVSHDDNLFLAEVARDDGITTASVVAFNYARNSRFNQGFTIEKIHPASASPREINANLVADDAIAQVRAWAADPTEPRFMLWLHFYDAHMPYVTHAGIVVGPTEHARYQGEVAWIDSQLARVMVVLDEVGLAANTAIALTGDHGEQFGEHGGTAHGNLYIEDLHVPLVIAVPGIAASSLATPVGLVDVAPTLAELLGLTIPADFDGDSLLPWIEGSAPAPTDRGVFSELIPDKKVPARAYSYITRDFHLIVDPAHGSRELFDLRVDPAEQHNVADAAPAEAADIEPALRRHLALRHGAIDIRIATPAQQTTGGWAVDSDGKAAE